MKVGSYGIRIFNIKIVENSVKFELVYVVDTWMLYLLINTINTMYKQTTITVSSNF